jgi:hypothetical protein
MTANRADAEPTTPEPVLLARLRAHFDNAPALLPVVEQEFAIYERPNLHLTVEEVLAEPGRHANLIGVLVLEEYQKPGWPCSPVRRQRSTSRRAQ